MFNTKMELNLNPKPPKLLKIVPLILDLILVCAALSVAFYYAYFLPHQKTQESLVREKIEMQASKLPTATEIFNLQSKCVQLGEKIMNDHIAGTLLYPAMGGGVVYEDFQHRVVNLTPLAHYNSHTGRCYVELDESLPQFEDTTTLYDGQTNVTLAYTTTHYDKTSGPKYSGMIYGAVTSSAPEKQLSEAAAYIKDMMDEDSETQGKLK